MDSGRRFATERVGARFELAEAVPTERRIPEATSRRAKTSAERARLRAAEENVAISLYVREYFPSSARLSTSATPERAIGPATSNLPGMR